jgi:hypothetical protein
LAFDEPAYREEDFFAIELDRRDEIKLTLRDSAGAFRTIVKER